MGHKIHPDNFRLGISKDWQYQLRDPLLANVFLYKTVRKLFLHYSAPYVSYAIRRDVNPRKKTDPKRKEKMINNPFFRSALVFSHLNISYAPSLLLAIFLFDVGAERHRVKEYQREKSFYYLSGSFVHEMRRAYSYFRKNMYIVPTTNVHWKAVQWKRYFQFYRSGLGRTARRPKRLIKAIITTIRQRYPKFFRVIRLRVNAYKVRKLTLRHNPLRYLPAWIINNYHFFSTFNHVKKVLHNLRILSFLLRYFKCYKHQNSKRRLFFLTILFNSITPCLYLLSINKYTKRRRKRYNTVLHKLVYLQNILFLHLTRYKNIYLKYNKKIFQSRLILFNLYAKILLFTVRKTAFIPTDRQLIIKFLALHNRNVSAQFLVNYITIRLGQYFPLNSIIKPIINRFKRLSYINGFRFIISGRLTRKERAAYIVRSHKSMPLSTSSIKIDYASDFRVMRFGVVGIKVYLLSSEDIPYYYFFEFKNKL